MRRKCVVKKAVIFELMTPISKPTDHARFLMHMLAAIEPINTENGNAKNELVTFPSP